MSPWVLEARVTLFRAPHAFVAAMIAGILLSGAILWHVSTTVDADVTGFGSGVWGVGALLFLATGSGLVSEDIQTGAVLFWIQKPRDGAGFFLRRFFTRAGVFVLAQSVVTGVVIVPLLFTAPAQIDAFIRVSAVVSVSILPLFGPAFLLSTLGSRYDAALSLALALLVAPPALALIEGRGAIVGALVQLWAHPWLQLDALSRSLAEGTPVPAEAGLWIIVQFVGWTMAGAIVLHLTLDHEELP